MKFKKNEKTRKTEKEMWQFYWDVFFSYEPLEQDMLGIWNYYDYINKHQKFVINKPL